jgi:hypothetical protein
MHKKYEYNIIICPWKRFFAREIDYLLYFIVIILLFSIFENSEIFDIIVIIILLFPPFIEFLLLYFFWNTIWKLLFWIRIINLNEPLKGLSFKQSFVRSFILYFISIIPLLNIIIYFKHYSDLKIKEHKQTSYDFKLKTNIYTKGKMIP